MPAVEGVLYGIKATIIAVILQAVVGLARTAIKTKWIFVVGVLAALASALGASPIVVLLVSGFAASILRWIPRSETSSTLLVWPGLLAVPTAVAGAHSTLTRIRNRFVIPRRRQRGVSRADGGAKDKRSGEKRRWSSRRVDGMPGDGSEATRRRK